VALPRGCRWSPHERGARAYINPARRYNTLVSAVSPQPDQQPSRKRPDKLRIYKLEAGGILILGALILFLTLTRYWHHIIWGAR
jgi:hypothetical protein